MNNKNILIAVGAILGTFLLLFIAYKFTNVPQTTFFPELNKIREIDHVAWNPKSKNILVEYSDLQCPACRGFKDFLAELEKTATPNASLVFRHMPLYQIHPNAFNAAYAAEAAAVQGKFWEMESALYDKQGEWSGLPNPKDYFVKLAEELKMDGEQFRKDIDSQKIKDRVQTDVAEAEKFGVNSTPTFFLNGTKLNLSTMDEFRNLLLSL